MAIENLKKGQINFLFSLFGYNIYIYIYSQPKKKRLLDLAWMPVFLWLKKEVIIINNNNIIIISILLFIYYTGGHCYSGV
jgi:hypothetical protein